MLLLLLFYSNRGIVNIVNSKTFLSGVTEGFWKAKTTTSQIHTFIFVSQKNVLKSMKQVPRLCLKKTNQQILTFQARVSPLANNIIRTLNTRLAGCAVAHTTDTVSVREVSLDDRMKSLSLINQTSSGIINFHVHDKWLWRKNTFQKQKVCSVSQLLIHQQINTASGAVIHM